MTQAFNLSQLANGVNTSGQLNAASYLYNQVPVANGGTGLSTLTAGYVPYGAGTSAFGSSASFVWDSANSRLGVGTASPAVKLAIVGTDAVLIPVGTTAQRPTAATGQLRFNSTTSQFEGYYGTTWQPIAGLTVDSSGNAGLGVTPSAWDAGFGVLQNLGGSLYSGSSGAVRLGQNLYFATSYKYATTNFATYYEQTAGQHRWYNAPSGTAGNAITFTQAMTLDASGNLLVGTTTSAGKLSVVSSASSTAIAIGTNNNYNNGAYVANDSTYISLASTLGGTGIKFRVALAAPDNAATIDSSGNFLVGTTSVAGPSSASINTGYLQTTVTTATQTTWQSWNQATSGNNVFAYFYTEGGGGTLRGSIDFNRGATLTRYNTTSDATLKNLIGDADGQRSLEILNTTRIREYAWKDDPDQKPQVGVIAQELYETYKGAVVVGGNIEKTDGEGNVTTEYRPWGVDKTAFTFHLIAGWQAHEKLIKEQQAIR